MIQIILNVGKAELYPICVLTIHAITNNFKQKSVKIEKNKNFSLKHDNNLIAGVMRRPNFLLAWRVFFQ